MRTDEEIRTEAKEADTNAQLLRLTLEVALDARRVIITHCSGDGYAIGALKQEIQEWWKRSSE